MSDIDVPWESSKFPQLRQLDSILRCSICKEIYTVPVISQVCSHTFCSYCIRNCLNENKCPVCNKELLDSYLVPNPVLEDISKWFSDHCDKLYEALIVTNEEEKSEVVFEDEKGSVFQKDQLLPVEKQSALDDKRHSKYFYISRKTLTPEKTEKTEKITKPKQTTKPRPDVSLSSILKKSLEKNKQNEVVDVVDLSDNEVEVNSEDDARVESEESKAIYKGEQKEKTEKTEKKDKKDKKEKQEKQEKQEKRKNTEVSETVTDHEHEEIEEEVDDDMDEIEYIEDIDEHLRKRAAKTIEKPKPFLEAFKKAKKDYPRLYNLDFSSMSVSKIRDKLESFDVPLPANTSSKTNLINYYNEYRSLWNAGLDSKYPFSKSSIIKKLKDWETLQRVSEHNAKLRKDLAPKEPKNTDWLRKYKNDFADLTQKAKLSKEKVLSEIKGDTFDSDLSGSDSSDIETVEIDNFKKHGDGHDSPKELMEISSGDEA